MVQVRLPAGTVEKVSPIDGYVHVRFDNALYATTYHPDYLRHENPEIDTDEVDHRDGAETPPAPRPTPAADPTRAAAEGGLPTQGGSAALATREHQTATTSPAVAALSAPVGAWGIDDEIDLQRELGAFADTTEPHINDTAFEFDEEAF